MLWKRGGGEAEGEAEGEEEVEAMRLCETYCICKTAGHVRAQTQRSEQPRSTVKVARARECVTIVMISYTLQSRSRCTVSS